MYDGISTIIIRVIAAYVIWMIHSLVMYGFLLRKAETPSPYVWLKRRRIQTESFHSKIDYHNKKLMIVWIVFLYGIAGCYILCKDFSHLPMDKIYLYAEAVDKVGEKLYAVTFTFLLAEFFYTLGSKVELSVIFFETLKLNGVRFWSVVCGVLSSIIVMRYDFLLFSHNDLIEMESERISNVVFWVCGGLLLLALHVGLLFYVLAIHMLYDSKNIRRKIAMQLSFSEICKSGVRGGSPELQRNVFETILGYYDIYSKRILGNRVYKAESISFASPLEKIYFSDVNQDGWDTIWYRKALFRMYRSACLAFGAEVFIFAVLRNNSYGIPSIVLFLPACMVALLAFFTLYYLWKTQEKNYSRVIIENYTSWDYIFSYRKRAESDSEERKRFSRDDRTYRYSYGNEQSYIRIIMSFMEYIRQVSAYENLGARSDCLHRDLVNHIFCMDNLERYELAQYRSLLILYHFALREEQRLLNDRLGGCDGVTDIEKQDFRYCVNGLDQKEKQRLHDFLYDVTLDYYGVEDSNIKASDGSARRKYKANRYFEEYWERLDE